MAPRRIFVLLFLLLLAGTAQAAGGIDELQAFYDKVHTLSANFQQVQRDDDGNVVQQASGTFLLSRPKAFRWSYTDPYKQIIVSDGTTFKFYDVDLEQVTIRDIGQTLKATPALLLTGGAELTGAFDISDGGSHDGMQWVKLIPRARDADFKQVEMGLRNNVPAVMMLDDNLGQTTKITFSQVEVNPHIASSRFKLKIPPGVEVVDGRPHDSGTPDGANADALR